MLLIFMAVGSALNLTIRANEPNLSPRASHTFGYSLGSLHTLNAQLA
jgi:hypothetical protein